MTTPQPPHVLIVGATSAMAEAGAREWARGGARLFLAARDEARLSAMTLDLAARYGEHCIAGRWCGDLCMLEHLSALVDASAAALDGRVDIALLAHGQLPDQAACEADPMLAQDCFQLNAAATMVLCGHLATLLGQQGRGTLAVISSVAGDRIRRSNYVYGTAKRTVQAFLEGLRLRLEPLGVKVVDVRPGFVISPMTEGLDRSGPLWVEPRAIAEALVDGISAGRPVLYLPRLWRLIMAVVRAIPRPIFVKLRL